MIHHEYLQNTHGLALYLLSHRKAENLLIANLNTHILPVYSSSYWREISKHFSQTQAPIHIVFTTHKV